jgi:hypothetical protein
MHEATLDRWTKQIVSIALRELREANGGLDQEALIGDLSQCVREVIDRELLVGTEPLDADGGFASELSMAVYLALAAGKSSSEVRPPLLLSLHRRLTDVCMQLATSTESNT